MHRFAIIVAALVLCPLSGRAATLGLFADPDATSCSLEVPPFGSATYYLAVVGLTPEVSCGGLTGVNFRIVGTPDSWSSALSFVPGVLFILGDAFGTGLHVAFTSLVVPSPVTVLASCTVLNVSGSANLRVQPTTPLINPTFDCPIVHLADPCFSLWCVDGGALEVNGTTPCTVGVALTTWSGLRALYR